MKKIILALTVITISVSAATIGLPPQYQPIPVLYGVYNINGQPVSYRENISAPEGFVAVIGLGSFAGTCYHDSLRYAVVKGSASCPGYFSVFPSISQDSNPRILKWENGFNTNHIVSGSPACEESADMHDPWN